MTTEILGGCLCGTVRYRFEGEPLAFYACHCTDCQRQTGSAFGLSLVVRRDDLELVDGEPARFEVPMEDGRTKCGRFCGKCAARVWGEPVRHPELFVLRPGSFDEPGSYRPWGDIWTSSAQPWVGFTAGPRYRAQPEDPMAMVDAWQKRPAGV